MELAQPPEKLPQAVGPVSFLAWGGGSAKTRECREKGSLGHSYRDGTERKKVECEEN